MNEKNDPKKQAEAERQERLAQTLRDNLKKRKSQSRNRKQNQTDQKDQKED